MKLLFLGFMILVCSISGIALASTVAYLGNNLYTVTNDSGFSSNMTGNQIAQKVTYFNLKTQMDSVSYLSDQQSYDVWVGVQQMALNALAQLNQVNGT